VTDDITFGVPRVDANEAIESLFHAWYPRLVYTAFCVVGDWDTAEQLAQDAYLRLWRHWRWLRDPQAAPAYLQRTVLNAARSTIRRRVVERRVLNAVGMAPAAKVAPDVAADVELRRAVAALPARKRACVVLRYLVGMSEAETAEVLSISVGTVKSQTHKGLRELRERLADPAAMAGPASAAEGTAR
jgi:RNA polymerase sigma-70 factor (sigma-E family)